MRIIWVGLLCIGMTTPAMGQSFNINIGPPGVKPSSNYGGAGLPGLWNEINTASGGQTLNLRDVNGVVTDVRVTQIGGTFLRSVNPPATTGDDDLLLDDHLVTYSPTLETCLFINALDPGRYEVIIYGWMALMPTGRSWCSSDEEPGFPATRQEVGGLWPGHHEENLSFSRHLCIVPQTGLLRLHSGIVPGYNPADGAAMNGVQIRKLPPFIAGDMNCNGQVGPLDVDHFVTALLDNDAYRAQFPQCDITRADFNGDGDIDGQDIAGFVDLLLP
jgi:hypothetical protein